MATNTTPAAQAVGGLEPMMSIEELADYLGLPVRTLYDWRQCGRGPQAIHVGRQLRYFVSDVRGWLDQQRESEASDGRPDTP